MVIALAARRVIVPPSKHAARAPPVRRSVTVVHGPLVRRHLASEVLGRSRPPSISLGRRPLARNGEVVIVPLVAVMMPGVRKTGRRAAMTARERVMTIMTASGHPKTAHHAAMIGAAAQSVAATIAHRARSAGPSAKIRRPAAAAPCLT